MAGGGTTLEYTPTWVVALVCSVIVSISFAVERLIHRAGKHFKNNDQKQLFGALQKIKEGDFMFLLIKKKIHHVMISFVLIGFLKFGNRTHASRVHIVAIIGRPV
jgi:hypothetical protein